eukprot:SAG22_NODE_585_length_8867_cov_11.509580_7_plen_637_part_00
MPGCPLSTVAARRPAGRRANSAAAAPPPRRLLAAARPLSWLREMKLALAAAALAAAASSMASSTPGPLACQPNEEQPMLPIYHIIGNVSKDAEGGIKLEHINDVSGVTYREGIYHVWHQCCQNHWDHVISRDLIHWQRLPPPIQPVTLKTWDGSISMLGNADPLGPVMIYDAQDGKSHERAYHRQAGNLSMPFDKPILGIARPDDPNDKYMVKWSRAAFNPVKFAVPSGKTNPGLGIAFPGPIWKEGDHWNFIGQGSLFSSATNKFDTWTRQDKGGKVMDALGGGGEHSGQWMMPVPKAIDGSALPSGAGAPNLLINVGGGERFVFATWDNATESLAPWTAPPGAPATGQQAELEGGKAGWWGASGGTDNNGRMMMIGWALPDYHGAAGPGIDFLTRLTMLREVNYEAKTQSLVSNPVPELTGLRTGSLASEKAVALPANGAHAVAGTSDGKAASADVVITFSGFTAATVPVSFGACVLGSTANHSSGLGLSVTVHPVADGEATGLTATVTVGECGQAAAAAAVAAATAAATVAAAATPSNITVSRIMPGTNFPHGDLHGKDHEFAPGTKPAACQALCDKTAEVGTHQHAPSDPLAGPAAWPACLSFIGDNHGYVCCAAALCGAALCGCSAMPGRS